MNWPRRTGGKQELIRRALTLILAAAGIAGDTRAATYFVSPSGSDRHSGLSPTEAWRTPGAFFYASLDEFSLKRHNQREK